MIEAITQAFRTPTAKEMAQRELANAERELLQAQTLRDYANSTVAYHQARITRLRGTAVPAAHAPEDF